MSGFDDVYAAVRRELAATPGKRVLIVEGPRDVDFLTFMLDKQPLRVRNAHARWVIGAAGGKDSVLRMLERQPDWFGLIDRDTMDEEEMRKAAKKAPRLRFLPRYCIESYFIEPAALEGLVGQAKEKARQRARQVIKEIQAQWPQAILHGSLWRAVLPLQEDLQALGFTGALLHLQSPDDGQVREVLRKWSDLMDDERIYGVYKDFQAKAEAMPQEQALRLWAHGKMFWEDVVSPAFEELLGEANESSLRRLMQRRMPLPEDMRALLEGLFDEGDRR